MENNKNFLKKTNVITIALILIISAIIPTLYALKIDNPCSAIEFSVKSKLYSINKTVKRFPIRSDMDVNSP